MSGLALLVVEDHRSLRRSIADILTEAGHEVLEAPDVATAQTVINERTIDAILLDVGLPDGTAFDLLDSIAEVAPRPMIVSMSGEASAESSFRLAQYGVRRFLQKPIDLAGLDASIKQLTEEPPDISPHIRNVVGHRAIHDVEEQVRALMVDEAVARTKGSKRAAAKLLSISRQLLQHILRQRDN